MAKPKLGSGKRFEKIVKEVEKRGGSEESGRKIAAVVGMKAHGKKAMGQMAKRGRARKN